MATKGDGQVIDITQQVSSHMSLATIKDGVVTVFIPGATGGITTLECEPGLVKDIQDAFERIAPKFINYDHHRTFNDGNGYSHIRAALLGPSLTVPFLDGKLLLGTYQQIVFIDFDNRSRDREIILQIVGE